MSEPPHPPRRPQQRPPQRPHPDQRDQGHPAQPYRDPRDQGYSGQGYQERGYDQGYRDQGYRERGYDQGYSDQGYSDQGHSDRGYRERGYDQGYQNPGRQPSGYRDEPHQPAPRPQRTSQTSPQQTRSPQPPPRTERGRPQRAESGGGGFRFPGLGVLLAIVGTVVQIVSLTLLPWLTGGAGNSASLIDLWKAVSANGGPKDFGDWYVLLFSYPLVILGVLLAFSAVLESVAMKVVWGGLALLGLGYVALRFGLGPFTGLFGVEEKFSAGQLAIGAGALVLAVGVAFALKTAITLFRRIAGVILLALSGVHVSAVVDLAKGIDLSDLSDLSLGAFGPTAGYLIIGIAALVGPRRFV